MSVLEVAPELQQRVRDRIEECSRATGIYIARLAIKYNMTTATTYGNAMYGWDSTIRLNPAYLNTHTDWFIEHICCHEYAHLATVQRHGVEAPDHGFEWRTMMEMAGVAPARCYEVELPDWVVVGPRQRIIDQPMQSP